MVQKRHLIVGIDPGTTTGVAMLGLDGQVLGVYSSRNYGMSDLVQLIVEKGYPLIVATDVSPVPSFVEKICHLFEAVLHEPPRSLTTEEKKDLTTTFAEKHCLELAFRNSHEKDALAAAIKAFESYGEKFRWIDKKLSEKGLEDIAEEVKCLVVTGRNLSDSIKSVLEAKKSTERPRRERPTRRELPPAPQAPSPKPRTVEARVIKNLRSEIIELKTKLKERELKIRSLRNELQKTHSEGFWEVVRSSEVKSRNQMILELKRSLSRVAADRDRLRRKLESMSESGLWTVADRVVVIPILENLLKDTVRPLLQSKNPIRAVMVIDGSGAGSSVGDMLLQRGVECVILQGELPSFARENMEAQGIVILEPSSISWIRVGDVALAEKRELEKAISKGKRLVKAKAASRAAKGLEKMIHDYRKQLT